MNIYIDCGFYRGMTLRKYIDQGTIDKFALLDVEFHHRLTTEYEPDNARQLIKQIKKRGVEVKLKEKLE